MIIERNIMLYNKILIQTFKSNLLIFLVHNDLWYLTLIVFIYIYIDII